MKTYDSLRYAPLLERLPQRLADAVLSAYRPADAPLRHWLNAYLSGRVGDERSLIGDPAIESVFRWETCDRTLRELGEEGLLHHSFVRALDSSQGDYRFPPDRKLFSHQLAALRALQLGKSILVSAGTGSGKTESFLFPILSSLCSQQDAQRSEGELVGVQALFIYPLNALIRSQKERLLAWTEPHKGRQKFALYNRDLPDKLPLQERQRLPVSQIPDRHSLRESPPPLLVTNTTMLELMLVRPADQPILQQSQGRLKWIVIDEAHAYSGTQAAELTLLLRRTLQAFGVTPSQVQFIATSATIGDASEESDTRLRHFLGSVAGCGDDRIAVIRGRRKIPTVDALPGEESSLADLEQLGAAHNTDPNEYLAALRRTPMAMTLRALVAQDGVASLGDIKQTLKLSSTTEAARWVDAVTSGKTLTENDEDNRFLPVRAHVFQRTLPGIWACVNRACTGRQAQELSEQWGYGSLFVEPRARCPSCESIVLELTLCNECGTAGLQGRLSADRQRLLNATSTEDEFLQDVEAVDGDESTKNDSRQFVLAARDGGPSHDAYPEVLFQPQTGEIATGDNDVEFIGVVWPLPEPQSCPCPTCGAANSDIDKSRRSIRLAAPFSLSNVIPELLTAAPPDPSAVGDSVLMQGRRLLTFTDSRQGTARTAARLYDSSLRDYVRYTVPQLLAPPTISDQKGAEIGVEIATLRQSLQVPGLPTSALDAIRNQIERLQAQLAGPAPTSWENVRDALATRSDVRHAINPYFKDLMQEDVDSTRVAHLLLLRELYRRPKRTNSLETLGLVSLRYPGLDQISLMPQAWAAMGGTLQEWKDYLKIYVDFFIRENACVELSRPEQNWIGTRFSRKYLVDAREQNETWKILWPKFNPATGAGGRHRMVGILRAAFPQAQAKLLENVLDDARNTLIANRLLKSDTDQGPPQRYLGWQNVALVRPRQLWLCPITRRLLDTTLRGVSPYHQRGDQPKHCISISLPVPLYSFWEGPDGPVAREFREEWLVEQKRDSILVERGLWPEALDRALMGNEFFSAREHSAQISQRKLDDLTSQFQAGKLNVLGCSTTMEMGVDIGSLAVVAMTNPPPTVANYMQRAGRAGRRGETRALAYTICGADPRALSIWDDPKGFLDTPVRVPTVRMDSDIVVQRHFNAWALREYLITRDSNMLRMKVGAFFGFDTGESFASFQVQDTRNDSPFQRFLAHLQKFENYSQSKCKQVSDLLAGSVLSGVTIQELLERTHAAFSTVAGPWFAEVDALYAQWMELKGSRAQEAALRALQFRLIRICGEHLLTALTELGLLPTRGFPVDVRELIIAKSGKTNTLSKEDRDTKLSRELPVALREYQPGASVVVDGAVHTVGALAMNWQRPIGASNVSEIQNIRWRLVCAECNEVTDSASGIEACGACGADASGQHMQRFEYIVPGGFVVPADFEANDDIARPTYVPAVPPLFSVRDENGQIVPRRPLQNNMGWLRAGRGAQVFHHTFGSTQAGFTICLACGRANADASLGDHRNPFTNRRCEPDAWAIRHVGALGATTHTDLLEFLLVPDGVSPLSDESVAWTLAVLIRNAAAEQLGVDSMELCFAVQRSKLRGAEARAILLYDRASGGAGYSSSIEGSAEALLRSALDSASRCPANCDLACPECLLSHDTRDIADLLDRHAVIRALGGGFQGSLVVPDQARRVVGNDVAWETRSLRDAVMAGLKALPKSGLEVFALSEDSLLERSETLAILKRVQDQTPDRERRLVVTRSRFESEPTFARRCKILLEAGVVQHVGLYESAQAEFLPAAAVEGATSITWAREAATGSYVRGTGHVDGVDWPPLDQLVLEARFGGNALFFEIEPHLPLSPTRFFDELFMARLACWDTSLPDLLKNNVDRIEYSDRYMRRRGCAQAFTAMVKGLVGGTRGAQRSVAITSLSVLERPRSDMPPPSDWQSDIERESDLRRELQGFVLRMNIKKRREAPHQRSINVYFDNGKALHVMMDPGLDYWESSPAGIAPTSQNIRAREKQVVIARMGMG